MMVAGIGFPRKEVMELFQHMGKEQVLIDFRILEQVVE